MNANDTQVGGTHYRTKFQHWDFAHQLRLGYFEGQITKYLTRHRFKKGKEDVDKALHFAKKLMELADQGQAPMHIQNPFVSFTHYGNENRLHQNEMFCIELACTWKNVHDLSALVCAVFALVKDYYPTDDGASPGSGYVNQG